MKYEHVINDCGMYLLQNNILYKEKRHPNRMSFN